MVLTTVVFPNSAPALPTEARTIREADGSSGLVSLAAVVVLSVVVGYAADWFLRYDTIINVSIAVAFAFLCAVANHYLGLRLLSNLAERVIFVLIPPLALIFLVLGTIFLGIATPTEGGAMGATGALILALFKRRLNLDLMRQAMDSTAKLSAFVIFILIGARVFSLTFYGVDGHKWVEELLVGLPGGEVGFLIVVNILVFVLAFFLDFFELAFIIVPLLGSGGRAPGHRPDLVRRDPGREHADLVHAPAVRLRPVLPALGRPQGVLSRQAHRQADGAGDHGPDLLRLDPVRVHPGGDGRPGDRVPAAWSCTTRAPAPASTPAPSSSSTCRRWRTCRRSTSAPAAPCRGWSRRASRPRCRAWSRRRQPLRASSRRRQLSAGGLAGRRVPAPAPAHTLARLRIEKLSKLYSATCHHRNPSFRNGARLS